MTGRNRFHVLHSRRIDRIANCLPLMEDLRTTQLGHAIRASLCGAQALLTVLFGFVAPATAEVAPAIAMHGAPALPDDFTALPYVNADAPKGGRLTEGVLGTFDSLNPLIVQGIAL